MIKDLLMRKNKSKRIKVLNSSNTPYILLTPAATFILLVVFFPIIKTFYYSLTNLLFYNPNATKFIGLDNYINLFKDTSFMNSLLITFKWILFVLSFQLVFAMVVALILNVDFSGRNIVRTIVLIPWVIPTVVTSLMWAWMYHGRFGVINFLLNSTGIITQNIPWLSQPSTALCAVIVAEIWRGIPFLAIMLLAGLTSIPKELYEASTVDGANYLNTFVKITLPMLKNTILVTSLLRIIWIANNVDMIFIMTGGGPASSTMTLGVNTYVTAIKSFRFGYASAMSVILTIILLIIAIFYVKNMNLQEAKI